ncbi:MAG TPA: hypothetical protein VFG68_05205 [Fimbriiglobus sp.]|nr:hypothetical protein [Fimbriiglobus sp.]
MPNRGRVCAWLATVAVAVGCHAPPTVPDPSPTAPLLPPELPVVAPASLEPDLTTLPAVDPLTATADDVAPPPLGYRGLTEEVCRREAAARASAAGLFNQENRIPARIEVRRDFSPEADALTREVRAHLAAEGRNRAAAEALDEFFQLADAEGRGELMRATLPVLDRLRETVRKARADGVRVPVDPDELGRQRASLLGLLAQADAGARALDIDLKRRIGVPGRTPERLRPVGCLGVPGTPPDVDATIRTAVETRPDLLALRTVYLQLSPETLPVVRELVRGRLAPGGGPTTGGALARPLLALVLARARARRLDAAALAELEVRRQQLYDLIAERERQAADEVRAAAVALTGQTTQVALARWKAEQLAARVAEAKPRGPLAELAAELEAYRARAEVVATVTAWHRARVKLLAAQGLLGEEERTTESQRTQR